MITPGGDGLGENQKHKREVSVFLNSSFKKYKLKKNLICTRLRTFVKFYKCTQWTYPVYIHIKSQSIDTKILSGKL